MTDETRAELRRGIEAVVRAGAVAIDGGWTTVLLRVQRFDHHDGTRSASTLLEVDGHEQDLPPLTTAQHLALSVLLGDPAVSVDYVLDRCQDDGRFVLRSADEVKKQERSRILTALESEADRQSEERRGWFYRAAAVLVILPAEDRP